MTTSPIPDADLVRVSVESLHLRAEDIARFAAATGVSATEPQVPHTLAAKLTEPVQEALLRDSRLGITLARTIHTEQQITVHAPLRAGETYRAEAAITVVRNTPAGRILGFSTTVWDRTHRCVQQLHTTLLTSPAEDRP